MPCIVCVRIAKACERGIFIAVGKGHTDVMVVLIVGDYVYGIVTVFDNVMALVRVDPCASEDLVPDGLVRYTDAEGSEAVNVKIES